MATPRIINIERSALRADAHPASGRTWRHLDLDCERLGVRIEELLPGETSSVHHWHTAEEEHALLLQGALVLCLGDETRDLEAGDHVCFRANHPVAHHFENRSEAPARYLVFGERIEDDLVFYPERGEVLRKRGGLQRLAYREATEARD